MTKQAENPDNTCENCGKPLFGRTDKRFCNDNCRNTYNRQKTLKQLKEAHENLPEIFRIIKRNYEILQDIGATNIKSKKYYRVSREQLMKDGFNFRFCTSACSDRDNAIWKFCFEYGWQEMGGDVLLGYWNDQAEIETPSRRSRAVPDFLNGF